MAVGKGPASRYNKRIRIEQPVADTSFDGAGSGSWAKLADVYAEVLDTLPSRAERLADGINVAARPARVRIRYRSDITAAMRFVLLRWDSVMAAWVPDDRVMQIASGPAELGRRESLEFMVEDFTSAGNAA